MGIMNRKFVASQLRKMANELSVVASGKDPIETILKDFSAKFISSEYGKKLLKRDSVFVLSSSAAKSLFEVECKNVAEDYNEFLKKEFEITDPEELLPADYFTKVSNQKEYSSENEYSLIDSEDVKNSDKYVLISVDPDGFERWISFNSLEDLHELVDDETGQGYVKLQKSLAALEK